MSPEKTIPQDQGLDLKAQTEVKNKNIGEEDEDNDKIHEDDLQEKDTQE